VIDLAISIHTTTQVVTYHNHVVTAFTYISIHTTTQVVTRGAIEED